MTAESIGGMREDTFDERVSCACMLVYLRVCDLYSLLYKLSIYFFFLFFCFITIVFLSFNPSNTSCPVPSSGIPNLLREKLSNEIAEDDSQYITVRVATEADMMLWKNKHDLVNFATVQQIKVKKSPSLGLFPLGKLSFFFSFLFYYYFIYWLFSYEDRGAQKQDQ